MAGNLCLYGSVLIVFMITTHYAKALRLPRAQYEPQFIFPWKDYPTGDLQEPIISKKCEEDGICKTVSNYPTDLATMLLKELKSQRNFTKFTVDKLYNTQFPEHLGEMEELCESRKEILFPQAAKDLKEDWYFILNVKGSHFQGYRIHQCLGGTNVTYSKAAYISNDTHDEGDYTEYKLGCEQTYAMREMIYLDLKKKILSTNYFNVPSCCSCKLIPIL